MLGPSRIQIIPCKSIPRALGLRPVGPDEISKKTFFPFPGFLSFFCFAGGRGGGVHRRSSNFATLANSNAASQLVLCTGAFTIRGPGAGEHEKVTARLLTLTCVVGDKLFIQSGCDAACVISELLVGLLDRQLCSSWSVSIKSRCRC